MSDHFSKSLEIEEAKWDSLPSEIQIDILLRLPIKSIITCTSVSKSWNSLIKSPKFMSTHLKHTILSYNRNQTHLLLLRIVGEPYSLRLDNEAFDEYTRFDFLFPGQLRKGIFNVVGTCNGLVCLANSSDYFVWNPYVRKYVRIKNIISHVGGTFNGFGFDSKTNDYKVVRVASDLNTKDRAFDVYSLATGKWNFVTAVPPRCDVRHRAPQAFVKGALHWVAVRDDGNYCFVLVFDLGDEDFREIMLPKDLLIKDEPYDLSVSVCGESLAVFLRMNSFCCVHVWVMKEYGVVDSWTKVLTVGPEGSGVDVPLVGFLIDEDDEADEEGNLYGVGFRKSGEVVIETKHGKLVSMDSESKKAKDLGITGDGSTFVDTYVESLVLLDKSKGAVSY